MTVGSFSGRRKFGIVTFGKVPKWQQMLPLFTCGTNAASFSKWSKTGFRGLFFHFVDTGLRRLSPGAQITPHRKISLAIENKNLHNLSWDHNVQHRYQGRILCIVFVDPTVTS